MNDLVYRCGDSFCAIYRFCSKRLYQKAVPRLLRHRRRRPCRKGEGKESKKENYPYFAVLLVDGMVCGNCARRIENTLNSMDGVWAKADVSTGRVTVRMKKSLSEQRLREAVNGELVRIL